MTIEGIIESWRYRELIYFFAWRDVKVRYKQAVLGAAWAVLQPLLTMLVFTVFFGRLAKVPSDGIPYPLFAYVGLVLWTYFSGVLGQASQSLVSNSNLITKVYFPRATLPLSNVLGGLLDFVISFGFVVIMIAYYRIQPGWPMLLAPTFVLAAIMFTLGAGLLIASLNVWYRDVKYVIPLVIQLWLFVTPVIYPMSFVPERFRLVMSLNPLAGIVEGFRVCLLLGRWPDPMLTAASFAATLAVLVLGMTCFRRMERTFADII